MDRPTSPQHPGKPRLSRPYGRVAALRGRGAGSTSSARDRSLVGTWIVAMAAADTLVRDSMYVSVFSEPGRRPGSLLRSGRDE